MVRKTNMSKEKPAKKVAIQRATTKNLPQQVLMCELSVQLHCGLV